MVAVVIEVHPALQSDMGTEGIESVEVAEVEAPVGTFVVAERTVAVAVHSDGHEPAVRFVAENGVKRVGNFRLGVGIAVEVGAERRVAIVARVVANVDIRPDKVHTVYLPIQVNVAVIAGAAAFRLAVAVAERTHVVS